MTAISFSNMSEYMKNFELTKQISQMKGRVDHMLRLILYMAEMVELMFKTDSNNTSQ